MATGFGHAGFVGFGPESTYGTSVASTHFCEIIKESLKGEHKKDFKAVLGRISRSAGRSVSSTKNVSGGFESPFTYDGFELVLKHALGAAATTGSNPYTHTFTCATALATGMTFAVNRDAASVGTGSMFFYEGCHISKLTFKQEMGEFLILGVDVVGEDWGNRNIETASFPTFTAADYSQFTMTNTGVAATVPRSFELTLDNTLATDRYKLGSRVRVGTGRQGFRTISGSMEVEFDSLTDYAQYRTLAANNEFIFTWTSGTNVLQINIPTSYIQGGDPEVGGQGPIMWTPTFDAYHATNNSEISITLTNSTSSIS
jgi:hypothetical protein